MPNDNHVAERADNYVQKVTDEWGEMGPQTRKVVWNAYQAGEERGYMRGFEAARLQGDSQKCSDCGKALTSNQQATGIHWCNPHD